jgi:hypothetical protein
LNSSMNENLVEGNFAGDKGANFPECDGKQIQQCQHEMGVFMSDGGVPKESLENMLLRENDNEGSVVTEYIRHAMWK